MSTPPAWPPPPPPSTPPGLPGSLPPPYATAPPPKKTSSAIPIAIVLIVVFFGGIVVLGIVAAIAVPGFLRARMTANETSAIGAMRTMVSAQVTWASTHAGHYAAPACLGAPASCGDAAVQSFLMDEMASLEPRSGYDFGFVLRPVAADAQTGGSQEGAVAAAEETPGVGPPGAPSDAEVRAQLEQFSTPDTGAMPVAPAVPPTPDSGQPPDPGGFAYWAVPSNPGVSGTRCFCVDETGMVLEYPMEAAFTPPTEAQPRCPDTGRPLS